MDGEVVMSEVKITALPNGPYMVEGLVQLMDGRGQTVDVSARPRVALCRCGHSDNKPFCDGSHSRCGFEDPKQS